MRTTRNAWMLAAAALAWAGTAAAGTVYLPLAINGALAGKTYRSYVSVTNGSGVPQEVAVRYIPQDTVGLGNGSTAASTLRVGAGQTFKLAVGRAGVGMVELSGPDDVIYSGRLESLTPGGVVRSSAHLPVVGADDLVPAGETAHVQWGERAPAGTASHFGVATFGAGDGTCTVKIFRADGSQVQSAVTLWAPALGQRWFPDAFNGLQERSISDARFAVTCNVPFFPFTTIFGASPDSTQFVAPSASGADGIGSPPPSNRNELVRLDGTFFRAVRGASIKDVVVPIPPRVRYGQLVYEFDVFLPRLVDSGPGGSNFHSTTLLLRPVRGGTHLAHTIRGNEKYKSILDLGVDDDGLVRGKDGAWVPNARHHVRIDYDVDAGRMTWELSRNGTLIERLVARVGVRDLTHRGEGLHILFGLDKSYDDEGYLPPYRAEFSNLVVTGRPPG